MSLRGDEVIGDDVISDVIKMAFTDKDRHLTKAFRKEKRDIANQLLKEYARETRVVVN